MQTVDNFVENYSSVSSVDGPNLGRLSLLVRLQGEVHCGVEEVLLGLRGHGGQTPSAAQRHGDGGETARRYGLRSYCFRLLDSSMHLNYC
jgi:hypothetical protein